MPLTVAMCSTALNFDSSRSLFFYVIHSGISSGIRRKIETSLVKTGCANAHILWIDAPLERVTNFRIVNKYLSALTYMKILLPEILPSDLDKVLYLDCDIVVNADLSELWDVKFGGKAVLAVRDRIAWVGALGGLGNYRELNISPVAKYFNSGVLYLDLAVWREKEICERICAYVRSHRTTLRMEDQEALNAVLHDDWGELPFKWNWQVPWRWYRNGRRKMRWVPEASAKNTIHFTTAEKPWLPGCDAEEKAYFFRYLDRTDWSGWRVPISKEVYARFIRAIGDVRSILGDFRRKLTRQRLVDDLLP